MQRGKRAAVNTAVSFLEEFVSLICGFILPRLILAAFGSKYNGLTLSISQFLSCAVLLRSGIGGATRAALYKPLATHNQDEINSIVKATDIFMKKIGVVLLGAILFFAVLYPCFVKNEFGWFFTFSLYVIIGASTFAESFFGITYLIVLQADQRLWISSLFKSICYILNTSIAAILIYNNFSIHAVKLGSAVIYVIYPIVLGLYVRRHYHIDTHVKPNNAAIAQRWDAFWQQVAYFVMNNTDIMVLTVFSNMLEVSVYSVYNLVINGIKKTVQSFTNGLEAAFGNMIARKEEKALSQNVGIIEIMLYSLSTIVCTCSAILILDFVKLYTHNVTDVEYIRPAFAYTILLAQFFSTIRLPYQLVVQAAGHYKQTKIGAIIEPIINIALSIAFVYKFGLIGVAVGTLVATIFRTIQYSIYMSKNLVHRSIWVVVSKILLCFVEAAAIFTIVWRLNLPSAGNYFSWFCNACVTFLISCLVVMLGNIVFFKNDTVNMLKKLKNIVRK
ncbi:MAG: polysaccharide biosynthesis C-terminal domain-containing protein [Clostridiales bacterium]|nr:polysaccharide biosynthesis C-terminal domain-containing protein [Clostridiales bacterium]